MRIRKLPGGPIIRIRQLGRSRSTEIPRNIPMAGKGTRIAFIDSTNEIAVTGRAGRVFRRRLYDR